MGGFSLKQSDSANSAFFDELLVVIQCNIVILSNHLKGLLFFPVIPSHLRGGVQLPHHAVTALKCLYAASATQAVQWHCIERCMFLP